MDAQETVLARHPDAEATKEPPILRHGDLLPVDHGHWSIVADSGATLLGSGPTEDTAWEDAATNLEELVPTSVYAEASPSPPDFSGIARFLQFLR